MTFFTRLSTKATYLLATTALGVSLAPALALAEDKVSAVHAFPDFLVYTKTFLAMVDDINERGKGIVQIEVRGGPEAIGMFQQPAAVRDGVVDMVHTPGSFYGANVPEIDAMVASNVDPDGGARQRRCRISWTRPIRSGSTSGIWAGSTAASSSISTWIPNRSSVQKTGFWT